MTLFNLSVLTRLRSCRRFVNSFFGPATSCQSHSFCLHMNDSDVSIGASVFQRRSSSRQRRNSSPQWRCLTSWSTRRQSWCTLQSHSLFENISIPCRHDRNHFFDIRNLLDRLGYLSSWSRLSNLYTLVIGHASRETGKRDDPVLFVIKPLSMSSW